jgi:malonyl-CoA O-methyltransferase
MTTSMDTQRAVPSAPIALGQIARSFGQAAAHYDEFAALQREVADHLLTGIDVTSPASILDLGCGTGYCASKLGARFPSAHLVALDLALPMLRASAVRVAHDTPLLCADMQSLPLQDAVAQLAVSSLSLQWCADLTRVFAELWRVLKPGGQALLSTFGPATLHELRAAWSAVDTHVHVNGFAGKAALEQAAKRAGFTVTLKCEPQKRPYASLRALARELKGIGAHNMNDARATGLTPRAAFARAEQEFGKGLVVGQGIPVTWEVYYLDLRKPR